MDNIIQMLLVILKGGLMAIAGFAGVMLFLFSGARAITLGIKAGKEYRRKKKEVSDG